jgi:hypothetical protein
MSTMSELDLMRKESQCAVCGTADNADTLVIDWRTDLMCSPCISRYDWAGWNFDPILNIYMKL